MGQDPLESCTGFDWDGEKNWDRHRVTPEEAEDVFLNEPLIVRGDVRHSRAEKRYFALGATSSGRRLFVSFTIRGQMIRVISAREMNRKEAATFAIYEKENS